MQNGSSSDRPIRRETAEDEYVVLSLQDLLQAVWRRLWLVLLITLAFVGVAAGLSLVQTPRYEASLKILIMQRGEASTSLGGDVAGLTDLTLTMAEAVDTRPVAQAVIERGGLPMAPGELLQNLSAEPIVDTQFIEVSYEDSDPERAQQIADSVGDVFSEQISTVVGPSASAVTATVWERATIPKDPVSPKPLRNVLLAFAVGAMLGVGLALLLEHLDDTWQSPAEAEQISGVTTLGAIPTFAHPREVKKGK
jgi:capsular polysaccharide biosynthesis protein